MYVFIQSLIVSFCPHFYKIYKFLDWRTVNLWMVMNDLYRWLAVIFLSLLYLYVYKSEPYDLKQCIIFPKTDQLVEDVI